LILASHHRDRRSKHLISNLFPLFFSSLLGSREPERSPSDVLKTLPNPYRAALLSMYEGEPQLAEDGERHRLDGCTKVSPVEGMWIYELCRKAKPHATLEIGLAYGFSTIYFLAALAENGDSRHTAIDPYQRRLPEVIWAGIGLGHGRRLGGDRFRFIEEPSFPALIHLADQSERFDVIFVDGAHLFDRVLVDFTLSAELCSKGGYIIFDDCEWPSIQRVVSFLRSNRRDFAEVETPVASIAVFQRTGMDGRNGKHFAEF
jgi:predicted O-methyltransferase YrrM